LLLAALVTASGHALLAADDGPSAGGWRYVVPAAGEPMEHPPLVPLALSEKKPDLILREPAYRGQPQYGLLRYGSDTSPQVPVVVVVHDGGDFDLFVDANRDGEIAEKEVTAGKDRLRRVAITGEINYLDRVSDEYPRQVIFRRGVIGNSIGVATLGYLEGQIEIAGRKIAARRVDGDANGLFSDPRDRVWLDLNRDGQWDPFSEQVPLQPVMGLSGKRYALRTDQAGTRLALEEITGVGTLRLRLATLPAGAVARTVEVALMGGDGSAYAVRSDGEAGIVPVGKYAVRSLRLSVVDSTTNKPWNFQFTRYEAPEETHWHHVAAGQELTLDPCGPLKLTADGNDLKKPTQPGRDVVVNPRLFTAEGLLINSSDCEAKSVERGEPHRENCAEVTLCQTDGTKVAQHTSGFA